MKHFVSAIICLFVFSTAFAAAPADRIARKAIGDGNKAYRAKDYQGALKMYNDALKSEPQNITALFNKALATTRIADALPKEKADEKAEMFRQASTWFEDVAKHMTENPSLASRANYNLGNISFNAQQYREAIDHYKNALRLNPNDNNARRNLRIAQQRLPKQNQNQNNDNNKQDQNRNKQNEDKDNKQNQDNKNEDKQNQNDKPQSQNPQPNQGGMSNQTADRILKRSADKENQTRKQATFGNRGNTQRSKRW